MSMVHISTDVNLFVVTYDTSAMHACAYTISNCEDYMSIKYNHMETLLTTDNGLTAALRKLESDTDNYWAYIDLVFTNTSGNLSDSPDHQKCLSFIKEVSVIVRTSVK